MEALSGVASGIAIASLSTQLAQSIGPIKEFIRGVRGATTELEGLSELLDRLNALLEDVRDIMERQKVLQDQHFSAPLMTIFNCLKSCETSLQSLQKVVEKHTVAYGVNASALKKLKEDIKFSFKMKDIAAFEARIQHDIDYLHAALSVNTTRILTAVLPVLLRNQYNASIAYSHPRYQLGFIQNPTDIPPPRGASPLSKKVTGTISTRQSWMSSSLERFNIYQRKSVRYISLADKGQYENATRETISECHEIFLYWRYLSYGIHWVQKYQLGSILPCLSTYPVVDEIDQDHVTVIEQASIQEIHKFFGSGRLHPFTRTIRGWSLLHLAASSNRADLCQLLLGYGLKPDLTHERMPRSPLMCCLHGIFPFNINRRRSSLLNTIRVFLLESDQIDDYEMFSECFSAGKFLDLVEIEWTWFNAAAIFFGEELMYIRKVLVEQLVVSYGLCRAKPITQLLIKLLDDEMLNHYLSGTWNLLPHVFSPINNKESLDSDRFGEWYLDLLQRLGLDVETWVSSELERLPGGVMETSKRNRKIIFEPHAVRGWILRWEWFYDPSQPGYLVVSEYNALSGDAYLWSAWPFFHPNDGVSMEDLFHIGEKWEARFGRRIAHKARKERARTGRKQQRSKMPGTWVW